MPYWVEIVIIVIALIAFNCIRFAVKDFFWERERRKRNEWRDYEPIETWQQHHDKEIRAMKEKGRKTRNKAK